MHRTIGLTVIWPSSGALVQNLSCYGGLRRNRKILKSTSVRHSLKLYQLRLTKLVLTLQMAPSVPRTCHLGGFRFWKLVNRHVTRNVMKCIATREWPLFHYPIYSPVSLGKHVIELRLIMSANFCFCSWIVRLQATRASWSCGR